jgi:hypothetical protein
MGPVEISGLPAHILLVHLVIVAVPVAALLVIAAGVWPKARKKLGVITPIVTLLALITVPITTHAGEWLEARVAITPLIRKHVALGKQLLPWMAALFLVAVLVWLYERAQSRNSTALNSPVLRVVVGIVAVAISVGAIQQVVRTGEAGSKAVWSGNFSSQPTH